MNILIDNEIFYNQKILELSQLFSFNILFNYLIDNEFINFIKDISSSLFNENQLVIFNNNLDKFITILDFYKKYILNKDSFFDNLDDQQTALIKNFEIKEINDIFEFINKDLEQLVKIKNELKEKLLSSINEVIPFEDEKKKNLIELVLDNPVDIINSFKEKKYYTEEPKKITKLKRVYEKLFASLDPHFKQIVFVDNNLSVFNNYVFINFIYDELLNFNVFIQKLKDLLTQLYT
ncbi:MAG: hypothetical protein ACP5RD_04140, partial [bacterium]